MKTIKSTAHLEAKIIIELTENEARALNGFAYFGAYNQTMNFIHDTWSNKINSKHLKAFFEAVHEELGGVKNYACLKRDDSDTPKMKSIMENKTSYTLQDALWEVAIQNGIATERSNHFTSFCAAYSKMTEMHKIYAAELYKEKATEELRKSNGIMNKEIKLFMLEIDRLKESNKELVEALRYAVSVFEAQLDQDEPYYTQAIEALKKSKP